MPKLLTITGMAIAVVILIVFLLDLIGHFLLPAIAPFQGASWPMDAAFVVCSGIIVYLSLSTYQEIK